MKNLLRAAAAAGVLLGVTTLAVASTRDVPEPGCQKDCVHAANQAAPAPGTPRADAPTLGPKTARVTLEVWSDFQCPYCARGAATVAQLRQKYGDRIRIVFRNAPLPMHGNARLAAAAAMAAHEQGRFWEFHDALFANQHSLDRASLEALAGKMGLDLVRFRQSLDTNKWGSYLDLDISEMNRRGIQGTPTFFVNDQAIVGAQAIDEFSRVIDAALAH